MVLYITSLRIKYAFEQLENQVITFFPEFLLLDIVYTDIFLGKNICHMNFLYL